MFRSSEDLKDTLLTKLLGKFIELHNAEFFQRQEKLSRGCIALFLPTTSRETGVNPTPESTEIEGKRGLKKHTERSNLNK